LIEAVGAPLVSLLERGEVHATVGVIQSSQSDNPFIESFPLSPLAFLAASQRPLDTTTRGDVDIGCLSACPLLLLETDFYVRQIFDAACRLAGVKLNVVLESRAPHTLLAMAEAGHGVAIVPSVLPTNRYRVRIARITHQRRPLRGTYAVNWDKRRGLPPYAGDFCESLAGHMRKLFPIGAPQPRTDKPRRRTSASK
jgi:DNA-binding transcriptional LysR family regulator